jgi:AraC-like DNA-binding protein
MPLLHLCFNEVAPGRDFHAALAADFARRSERVSHTHDFSEVFYVLDGAGTHFLNTEEQTLRAGDLCWIRPQDRHAFSVSPGKKMHFINIAFRQSCWADFRQLALETSHPASWETGPHPPAAHVSPARRGDTARLFQDLLHSFHTHPTRLALCRFWGEVLPLLLPSPSPGAASAPLEAGPPWLSHACLALHSEEALRAGVPRLAQLCGVSPAHLARTLKAATGLTPTEWVNALRLERAALLLATTTDEIIGIADECGFENLSYFYRLFHRRFGQSPRRYRLSARAQVLP